MSLNIICYSHQLLLKTFSALQPLLPGKQLHPHILDDCKKNNKGYFVYYSNHREVFKVFFLLTYYDNSHIGNEKLSWLEVDGNPICALNKYIIKDWSNFSLFRHIICMLCLQKLSKRILLHHKCQVLKNFKWILA